MCVLLQEKADHLIVFVLIAAQPCDPLVDIEAGNVSQPSFERGELFRWRRRWFTPMTLLVRRAVLGAVVARQPLA